MIYCMSDIHGELDRFKAMLDLINFSSDDTLYIIGDVIDRHPGGVEILKIIKDTPNMFMLLGNHEQMCLDTQPRLFLSLKDTFDYIMRHDSKLIEEIVAKDNQSQELAMG